MMIMEAEEENVAEEDYSGDKAAGAAKLNTFNQVCVRRAR